MKKILMRLLLAAALLVIVAVAAAYFTVRASLPQLDGNIEVAGLGGDVSIVRDAAGIPTISATSRHDLAFATGYAHGQDRFFQMDLIRRQAAGELSELIGPGALETDKRYRFHRFRALANEVLAMSPAESRAILEAYTAGVNAGRNGLGARPFEYWLLQQEPVDWRVEDSVLVVYAMYMQLNDSRARKDVKRGLIHRVLPRDVYGLAAPGRHAVGCTDDG